MFRVWLLAFLALAAASCASVREAPPPTQVMVVASIHSAHRDHPTYSYERLFETVRAFQPDVVAVEIRPEDLGRDPAYLARNYPSEMITLAQAFGPHARGVDWLGDELAGAPAPDDWWAKGSWVKRLEREIDADPAYRNPELQALQDQQMEIVRSATAASLNDGRYDAVTRAYYQRFAEQVAGGPYERLAQFYAARDRQIAGNVARIVAAHPGRRIAVVLGADHRGPVVDELGRRAVANHVALVPVP